jgi:hypothetical protein
MVNEILENIIRDFKESYNYYFIVEDYQINKIKSLLQEGITIDDLMKLADDGELTQGEYVSLEFAMEKNLNIK